MLYAMAVAPHQTPYWSPFFTWWMIGGAVLYGIVWWRVLTAQARAWFASMTSIPLSIYWLMPVLVYFGMKWNLVFSIPFIFAIAFVGVAPLFWYFRYQNRVREAEGQARADAAENVIQKLGA